MTSAGEVVNTSETVCLSQLADAEILWPGDVRALAESVLRHHDATDGIFKAIPHGSVCRFFSTLHGVAGYDERITGIAESQIKEWPKKHGLRPGATVEFDPPPPPSSQP